MIQAITWRCRPRTIVTLIPALLFGLPGCDGRNGVRDDVALEGFQTCADLESHIKAAATQEMNATIDRMLKYNTTRRSVSEAQLFAGPSQGDRASAADYTTTNTQEKGVDEPDFVKNDGSRIFALHDRQLAILAAWPPESARLESVTGIEGYPREMFLQRNRVVVFSQVSLKRILEAAGVPPRTDPTGPGDDSRRFAPVDYDGFKVTVLDVSGIVPRALYEYYIEGRYITARRLGDSIHVVSSSALQRPDLRYWPQRLVDWRDHDAVRAAFEELRSRNLKKIEAAPLEDWLPRFVEHRRGGDPREVKRPCSSFYASNAPTRLGLTTVSTLQLRSLQTRHTSVLSDADEVYASRASLYLAARHFSHSWSDPWETPEQQHTYLHKFDIASNPAQVRYVASGGVPGHIADQFSLDEEGAYLRVATTRQRWNGWRDQQSTNSVFVLRSSHDRLVVSGELSGLAPGERIFSARFDGTRGFLVTFRLVDPLFTLDMRDPREPRIAGELKVPGFSTYIHTIDRSHLLTIGRDAAESGWRRGGVQLQVFDVTTFASPVLKHKHVLGADYSWSTAEHDHKAFNYFGARGLLAIPFSDWSPSRSGYRFVSTLEVLKVTPEIGILPMGSIDHADLLNATSPNHYTQWTPMVRRSVMMEDYVYSISYGGVKVNHVGDPSRPLATIALPAPIGGPR